ncbi:MAG: hypothetical protein R3D00_05625 [Bacteroidia bacterium]
MKLNLNESLNKLRHSLLPQLFTIYLRYLIGGAFVFASLIKIKGGRFTGESGEDMPIDTAWHFFETLYRSGLYWKFIGLGQLIAGGLLMTQKFSKLGAVIFMPIVLNIFIITLSYDFHNTPIITGGLVLANVYLLIWDWPVFKLFFGLAPEISNENRLENQPDWIITGIVLFLFTAAYRFFIDSYNVVFWLVVCGLTALTGLIIGLKR